MNPKSGCLEIQQDVPFFLHFELKTNNKQFLQNILIRNFTLTVVMMLQSASIQLYMASESKVQTPMRNITIQLFR
jgi:hypothetical protein